MCIKEEFLAIVIEYQQLHREEPIDLRCRDAEERLGPQRRGLVDENRAQAAIRLVKPFGDADR
eukprot:4932398-Pleurochrysis_carterae.AAC.2